MYVTTFYSFKGGVGRTFALVNVASALARAGRKVLLVDFDLEAPGIQTFNSLKPKRSAKGIVEFVSDYLSTGETPDVRDYVYETNGIASNGGRLWVMPAGKGDCDYRRKLSRLHWQSIYAENDGFLLIEDLKAQWEDAFNPDYVFIDSRTGHTDIEGICTRQLPDAVVLLFFPNEQNLVGLIEVVNDIRQDSLRSDNLPRLHFVVSNVPELDDEEDVLKGSLQRFRKTLRYRSQVTIHNYPSLALVDQCIFVLERPKSRLTREYLRLKDAIIEQNMRDREAALEFLRNGVRPYGFRFQSGKQDLESRLEEIRKYHPTDGEIIFLIAMLRRHEGRSDEASQLLDKAIEFDYRPGKIYLERAAGRINASDKSGAIEDVLVALDKTDLTDSDVERAARMLGLVDDSRLGAVWDSVALHALPVSSRLPTVRALSRYRKGLPIAIAILRNALDSDDLSKTERSRAENQLILSLVGDRQFDEAAKWLSKIERESKETDISDQFNLAMNDWARTKQVPVQSMNRVLDLFESEEDQSPLVANYAQCRALALAAVGRVDDAKAFASEAKRLIERAGEMEFSCWRYLNALPRDFVSDCDSIVQFAENGVPLPSFFTVS